MQISLFCWLCTVVLLCLQSEMSFQDLLKGYAAKKSGATEPTVVKMIPESVQILNHIRFNRTNTCSGAPSDLTQNLGILFIIIDNFPNETLWRLWLEEHEVTNHPEVKIWFHAKYPNRVKSTWVRERLVKQFHYSPEWGSIEITKVMFYVLKEATKEAPHINKFIFASESCVPIVPLSQTIESLYHSGSNNVSGMLDANAGKKKSSSNSGGGGGCGVTDGCAFSGASCNAFHSSWLHYHNRSKCNGYSVGYQFDALVNHIPTECIYKADQWLVLSRPHAMQIIALKETYTQEVEKWNREKGTNLSTSLFSVFRNAKATDEMFFPTCLSILGHIGGANGDINSATVGDVGSLAKRDANTSSGNNTLSVVSSTAVPTSTVAIIGVVYNRLSTYCDWSANEKRPRSFLPSSMDPFGVSAVDLQTALKSGSVFLRKLQMPEVTATTKSSSSGDQNDILQSLAVQFVMHWLYVLYPKLERSVVRSLYEKRVVDMISTTLSYTSSGGFSNAQFRMKYNNYEVSSSVSGGYSVDGGRQGRGSYGVSGGSGGGRQNSHRNDHPSSGGSSGGSGGGRTFQDNHGGGYQMNSGNKRPYDDSTSSSSRRNASDSREDRSYRDGYHQGNISGSGYKRSYDGRDRSGERDSYSYSK